MSKADKQHLLTLLRREPALRAELRRLVSDRRYRLEHVQRADGVWTRVTREPA